MRLVLSAPAEQDIEDILRFTLKTWGGIQFENYYSLIHLTLEEMKTDPFCITCKRRDDLFVGCYSRSFGKHIVFYRVMDSQIEVVRILHQMMDHGSHF